MSEYQPWYKSLYTFIHNILFDQAPICPFEFAKQYYTRRGWYVDDGTLYGVDLLLYTTNPKSARHTHSPYAVRIVLDTETLPATSLVGLVRICHGLQKTLIICHLKVSDGSYVVNSVAYENWFPEKTRQ